MKTLSINGSNYSFDAPAQMPLLWVLRDLLELTGTKYSCGIGLCGACTVLIDGKAVRSCSITVGSLDSEAITTIEGLPEAEALHPVQEAWEKHDVPQCGYCQSGQIMSALALLNSSSAPSDEEIDNAMEGNLCRCGTYSRIKKAIKEAAENYQQN